MVVGSPSEGIGIIMVFVDLYVLQRGRSLNVERARPHEHRHDSDPDHLSRLMSPSPLVVQEHAQLDRSA
jgi:hypothetical protein